MRGVFLTPAPPLDEVRGGYPLPCKGYSSSASAVLQHLLLHCRCYCSPYSLAAPELSQHYSATDLTAVLRLLTKSL